MIGFVHQHEVKGRQGGIERYLDTLLSLDCVDTTLITVDSREGSEQRIRVRSLAFRLVPSWVSFNIAMLLSLRSLRRNIASKNIDVIEYSRPEYIWTGVFLPGRRIFTIHGTGPVKSRLIAYLVHHISLVAVALSGAHIQVVGADKSGLSRIVQKLASGRILEVHAWFDEDFRPSSFPPLPENPFRILYAGRLSEQKNPSLLAEVIRESANSRRNWEFHYCGSDDAVLDSLGVSAHVIKHGMLSTKELSSVFQNMHVLVLTSSHGEGSPFIVVEAMACGRLVVMSKLPTLVDAYETKAGSVFASEYSRVGFSDALSVAQDLVLRGQDPSAIAKEVSTRSKTLAGRAALERLRSLAVVGHG